VIFVRPGASVEAIRKRRRALRGARPNEILADLYRGVVNLPPVQLEFVFPLNSRFLAVAGEPGAILSEAMKRYVEVS
jgi:hypothetical protein